MALISDLIRKAFYIAKVGGISRQGGQTPSTAQELDGLFLLNNILDSLSLQATFNSFLYQLTLTSPTTREIYIGRNLNPVTDVSIVDADPFKLIFGASISVPINPYPLIIQSLVEIDKVPFSVIEGQPGYLYWGLQEQDGNIFTHISLYPTPNQTGDVSIVGTRVLSSSEDLVNKVLPTFFNYLKYRVAKELSAEYGNLQVWIADENEETMQYYEGILGNNSPINASPNDMSPLLERQYNGNYPWY